MPTPGSSLLDSSHLAFLQQGVSMLIASRDTANRPYACRAAGCRISGDGRLMVFVDQGHGQRLLDAVNESKAVAVVFSDPPTHKTIQVKGIDAMVVSAGDCAALLDAYAGKFVAILTGLGYSESMARALVYVAPGQARAVLFTPTALFDQTPGPGAGAPIKAGQ